MVIKRFAVLQILLVALAMVSPSCADFLPYRYQNVYSMTLPQTSGQKSFVDNRINIRFWIDDKRIHFVLKNLADDELTISWRDAMYIHTDGVKHKLANQSSIFTASRRDPDPTIVKTGDKLIDYVVPMEDILTAAKKHRADIIALSALMTTTMIQMKVVIDQCRQRDYIGPMFFG